MLIHAFRDRYIHMKIRMGQNVCKKLLIFFYFLLLKIGWQTTENFFLIKSVLLMVIERSSLFSLIIGKKGVKINSLWGIKNHDKTLTSFAPKL